MTNETQTMELSITGMTCSHCTNTVRRALRAAPGVQDASVDLASETARVVLMAGAATERSELVRAVEDAGYGVAGESPAS